MSILRVGGPMALLRFPLAEARAESVVELEGVTIEVALDATDVMDEIEVIGLQQILEPERVDLVRDDQIHPDVAVNAIGKEKQRAVDDLADTVDVELRKW